MAFAPICKFCGRSMLAGTRDGATITAEDRPRMDGQMARVYEALADGHWHQPDELEAVTGDNWASIGARLRDLRKERFGGYNIERESRGDGVFAYRIGGDGA